MSRARNHLRPARCCCRLHGLHVTRPTHIKNTSSGANNTHKQQASGAFFRDKEKPRGGTTRNEIFGFGRAQNGPRSKKMIRAVFDLACSETALRRLPPRLFTIDEHHPYSNLIIFFGSSAQKFKQNFRPNF